MLIAGSDISDEETKLLEQSGFVVERVESIESVKDGVASQRLSDALSDDAVVCSDRACAESENTRCGGQDPRKKVVSNMTGAIAAVFSALAFLTVAGVIAFGGLGYRQTQPLPQLPWIQPTVSAFIILSCFAIAVLCLARYRALGGAWVFWAGLVFVQTGVLDIFYMLSWPGLVGHGSVIGHLPNTAAWLIALIDTTLSLLLLAVIARRPERLKPSRCFAAYAGTAAFAFFIGVLSVRFERVLPILVVGLALTRLEIALAEVALVVIAAAAVFAYRRHVAEKDAMLGYLVLFLIVFGFALSYPCIGGKRYDIWWYAARVEAAACFPILLLGFLHEGYALFSAEQARGEEHKRLLAAVQESEQRLRMLYMSVNEGFYLADIIYDDKGEPCDYRYVEVNPAFEQILGLSRNQIIGRRYREMVPDFSSNWFEVFREVAATGTPADCSFHSEVFHRHFGVHAFSPSVGKIRSFGRGYYRTQAGRGGAAEQCPTIG